MRTLIISLFALLSAIPLCKGEERLSFAPLFAFDPLPSEEVTRIMQDSDGYLWFATHFGLCRYDGYRIRTYQSNFSTPGLLVSNAVRCMAEDRAHRIWIGTNNGVSLLDRTTDQVESLADSRLVGKVISTIYASSDSSVWIAADGGGLFRYHPGRDSLAYYGSRHRGEPLGDVKTILEDSRGRLWFGTWADGYFRYDPAADRFIPYPRLNDRNSVHVLFEDSRHTLWAGTWDAGLYRLEGEDSPSTVRWRSYRHDASHPGSLSDDIVYSLEEDVHTHTLWIGTRSGLSLLDLDRPEQDGFVNYLPGAESRPLPYNEVNAIVRDRSGMFWLGMMGGGVYSVDMSRPAFQADELRSVKRSLYSNSVRSMLMDSDGTLWLGIGSYGLMIRRAGEKEPIFYRDPRRLGPAAPYLHTVNHIIETRDHREIWMGTWGNGAYIYDKRTGDIRSINTRTHHWLADNYVFILKEDHLGNFWFGGRDGLSVLLPDGTGLNLTALEPERGEGTLRYSYYAIEESRFGTIWLGTNHGVIRAEGDLFRPERLRFQLYCRHNGKLAFEEIQCILEDRRGRLWVGSEGGGLSLYDPERDRFEPVNNRYGLLAEAVFNLSEDADGNLWMGTNAGLVRLTVSEDARTAEARVYTTADGLCGNIFIRNAVTGTADGRLFFGGHNGYNSFLPVQVGEEEDPPAVSLTDILVHNVSLRMMPDGERERVSHESPDFTRRITLDHRHNNLSLEFSALSYLNPSRNQYAYRLEGYEPEWRYTGASNRTANYNALPPGDYTFHLKGSNGNGVWSDAERTVAIRVLPPPWQTGWAYTLYIMAGMALLYGAYRWILARARRRQRSELERMERVKSEEVNQAKLRFFTNVTHEFMTPLTILSASVDELRHREPGLSDAYAVMSDNVNRLIRLIQQILEFRKAETGNLRLRVSRGDLLAFTREKVEAFRPLMRKRGIRCELLTGDLPALEGFFDPDKLDKILYNLLSNAAKYNREGGSVVVRLERSADGASVTLSVSDEGPGLSAETRENLFRRFYEGDYRRFHTTGNGIGLSLTRDLVLLHGGTIRAESEEGRGTTFVVTLPIGREAFRKEDVDDEAVALPAVPPEPDPLPPAAGEEPESASSSCTLLLVEDNEDLLRLMSRLLSRDYRVLVARDGKEALEQVAAEDISLVVSDVMMPVMDGIALCRAIKGNADSCHIPILLLTAKSREEDRVEAYDSGADAFLSKPFNLSLLQSRVRNLLRARARVAHDFKKQLVFEASELSYTSMDEEFLSRAVECVRRHLADENFDQPQFIDEMGTSKSTLYKKLKSLTGLNTSAFIRNIRLKAACQIMDEKGRVRISEVAYAVGFSDPKYFSACFKKEFGMLPSEYMERGGQA